MSSTMTMTLEKSDEAGFGNATPLEAGPISLMQNEKIMNSPSCPDTTAGDTTATQAKQLSSFSLRKLASLSFGLFKPFLPQLSSSKAETVTEKLEDYPEGYPRLAYLLDSDDAFMIYRKFGRLCSRLLLHKQDKLRELEAALLKRDKDNDNDDNRHYNRGRDWSDIQPAPKKGPSRTQIMEESEKVLKQYTSLLKSACQLQAMNRPTDRDHASVSNYFWNHKPLQEPDDDWIRHKEDLITIRPGREHAWLDSVVESFLRCYPNALTKRVFCDQATRNKTSDGGIHYFSRSRIGFLVTFIITMLILILLVVPIWVLYWLSTNAKGGAGDVLVIGVLLICTLVFSAVLSLFTQAKRHELLAASAGYCAVLVVFVANVGGGGITTPLA